ncbi:MAG TPA: sensor histidine kinase [Paraburkholderia sp.]|nr:sensor histidine kinase [Paraburkholderia sp.]
MPRKTPSPPASERSPSSFVWRDLGCVIALTVIVAAVCMSFDVSELAYHWMRREERFQVDELPATLLVLALGLAWFAWRRWRELQRELVRRRALEAQAARLLDDNRRLVDQANDAQERERRHLARELHDELGQYLNAISLDGARIRDVSADRDPESHRLALNIVASATHVYRQIGTMIRRLRPIGLDELGLATALEHCVDGWRERLPDATFTLVIEGEFSGLSDRLNITLYRLVQEGLTNVSKFARASRVEIYLLRAPRAAVDGGDAAAREGADEIVVTMADDGPGVDLAAPRAGLGLIGMRERVEALGGEFKVASEPANGFMFCARVPAHAGLAEPVEEN